MTINIKKQTPVETLIINFCRGKKYVMMEDIINFRGKDQAHTIRVINRLIWRKILKRGGKIGNKRIIKVTKQI